MIDRREFIQGASALGVALSGGVPALASQARIRKHPLAITMWDFSWLERRWPGAGYEDWDRVLDELKQRGYDAVRIDAYPHLIAANPTKEWELVPVWDQQDWGSPAVNRVRVQPHLNEFIAKCFERGILVALSTWWRQDPDNVRMNIKTPQDLAGVWLKALQSIPQHYLKDTILYVDFSNEFCISVWTPWIPSGTKRDSPEGTRWMRDSIGKLKQTYPNLPCTFSFTSEYQTWRDQDVSMLDLMELHCWMTTFSDFNHQVGYKFERFSPTGYHNLQKRGEALYRSDPAKWQASLTKGIDTLAEWSRVSGKPLMTTECWSVVDYKDWPLLHWDWIKELCEIGVRHASSTGRWEAMATSNFCGPQFVGMWRDVDWHRRMTGVIHQGQLPPSTT
ncbi:MAG: cellulase-like family protein [Acidobacteriaceae bacterium]